MIMEEYIPEAQMNSRQTFSGWLNRHQTWTDVVPTDLNQILSAFVGLSGK